MGLICKPSLWICKKQRPVEVQGHAPHRIVAIPVALHNGRLLRRNAAEEWLDQAASHRAEGSAKDPQPRPPVVVAQHEIPKAVFQPGVQAGVVRHRIATNMG